MYRKAWLILLAAALTLSITGCGQQSISDPPVETTPESVQELQEPQMTGQYESIEAYARQKAEGHDTVDLRVWEAPSQSLAEEPVTLQIVGRELLDLDCSGALDGLDPKGTLESWGYHWLIQLDLSGVDPDDIVQAGGMYIDEEGNYSSGYSTMVIALRYPDGSYDVLYDETNVEFSDFSGYHDNMEESIHDWYVKEYGLDQPLYVQDWIDRVTVPEGGSLGNFPVHRVDGDGWYIYIPVSPWSRVLPDLREGKHWEWTSDYGTGSTLTVDRFSQPLEDEYTVSRKQGYTAVDESKQVWERRADGITSYYYFFAAPDGGSWRVEISWVDANISDYPYIAMEPKILRLMAESFCVDETMKNVRELTASEIERVNEAFDPLRMDTNYISAVGCFFTSYYDSVEELDLAEFLRYFPGDGSSNAVTEAEFDALKALDNWPFGWSEFTQEQMPVPIHKFTYKEINRALERYAGITLDDLAGAGSGEGLYHLPEYEAYYNNTSDAGAGTFYCTRGETDGDVVKLYEETPQGTDVLTLHKKNGQYFIVSHIPLEEMLPEDKTADRADDLYQLAARMHTADGKTIAIPDEWGKEIVVNPDENFYLTDQTLFALFCEDAFSDLENELGWILSICYYKEDEYQEMYVNSPSRQYVFAKDDFGYYCVLLPTDIQTDDPALDEFMENIRNNEIQKVVRDMISRNDLEAYKTE